MNQDMMELLSDDDIEVCWMFHVDIDPRQSQAKLQFDAPTVVIGRYFVKDGKGGEFQEAYDATSRHLAAGFSSTRPFRGGWRIDEESIGGLASDDEKEEFVLFSGWDDVTHHMRFAESEGFNEFDKLRDLIDGAVVKHAVKLML